MNNPRLFEKMHHLVPGRIAAELLGEFGPRLRWGAGGSGDEAVLDVGSGTGLVTRSMLLPLLPARVRRVVGADLAPEMVRFAQTTHAHADPRLRFVQADIADGERCVPLLRREAGAGGFSKIFSIMCLHWVQDHRTAMRNMYDLLRTDGEVLLVFFTQSPFHAAWDELANHSRWRRYLADAPTRTCPYKHSADPGRDFSHLLSEAGFHAIDCRWVHKSQTFDDIQGLNDLLVSVNPYMDRIPEADHDEFKKDNLEEVLKHDQVTIIKGDKSDTVKIDFSLMIAFLEKKKRLKEK